MSNRRHRHREHRYVLNATPEEVIDVLAKGEFNPDEERVLIAMAWTSWDIKSELSLSMDEFALHLHHLADAKQAFGSSAE